MLGPFATASRLTPIHQVSLAVLSRAACASMSTTSSTTTTTRDRGDRYGPMEWAQSSRNYQIWYRNANDQVQAGKCMVRLLWLDNAIGGNKVGKPAFHSKFLEVEDHSGKFLHHMPVHLYHRLSWVHRIL